MLKTCRKKKFDKKDLAALVKANEHSSSRVCVCALLQQSSHRLAPSINVVFTSYWQHLLLRVNVQRVRAGVSFAGVCAHSATWCGTRAPSCTTLSAFDELNHECACIEIRLRVKRRKHERFVVTYRLLDVDPLSGAIHRYMYMYVYVCIG